MENNKICIRCHAYIPEDSLYCPSCGKYLLEGEPRLENIAKDLLAVGEKKFITVIFVLIESKKQKAHTKEEFEERKKILLDITEITKSYGGWMDKWIGMKGAMIIFGIPRITRLDPQLACKLALEIKEYLDKNKDIIYKIGINSGWVYFGKVGSSNYLHKTVIGDAVNIAYRLAEIANSEIIISEETNLLVEENFFTVKKKKIFLKGHEEILSIYELKGIREERKKIKFRIPFVGREEEIELLNSHAELAKKRKGSVLFIKGPAGIGKTTLKNYWLKMYKEKDKFFIFEGEPLFEIHDIPCGIILRAIKNFLENPGNTEALKNFEEYQEIKDILMEREKIPVQSSYIEILKMALRKFLERVVEIKPVLFIIDSLEKGDELTLTVLEYLLITLESKVFFLLFGRENLFPIELAFIKEKNLRPFNFEEIEKILNAFFKEKTEIEFVRKFHKLTEGIPLYVTEFLKIMAKRGNKTLDIPSSLIGTILEFYDILSPEEKGVLEKISILIEWDREGPLKEFFDENEKKIIENFVEEEILEKDGNVYKFLNPLVRNVIYNSILKRKKIETHIKVVEILDHRVDIKQLSPYLFYHSYNGEMWGKAMEFALISGKERLLAGAFKEAIDYFNRAQECFEKIREGDVLKLVEIFEYRAEAKKSLGLIDEAIKDLHRSIVIVEGIKNNKLFSLKQKLAQLYIDKKEIQSSKKMLMELLESKEKMDKETLLSSYLSLGEVYYHMGQYHLSLGEYHKAYNVLKEMDNKKIYNIALELSKLHTEIGNFEMAKEYSEMAEDDVKKYKDILSEFKIKENKFELYSRIGVFQKILKEIEETLHVAKFIDNKYHHFILLSYKALITAYLKNITLSKKYISEALKLSKDLLHVSTGLINIARAIYLIEEIEYLKSFLKTLYKNQEIFTKPQIVEINLLLAKISESEPEKFAQKAFELSKSLTSPYLHLRIFSTFLEIYNKRRDKDKTIYYYRKANYIFKELANKFKDDNLKKVFLLHPDFEPLRTVSFFTL